MKRKIPMLLMVLSLLFSMPVYGSEEMILSDTEEMDLENEQQDEKEIVSDEITEDESIALPYPAVTSDESEKELLSDGDVEDGQDLKPEKESQELAVSVDSSRILVGHTAKIQAEGIGKITYTSSDQTIASVSSKGIVKGKKKGKVTIAVHASGDATHKAKTRFVKIHVAEMIISDPVIKKKAGKYSIAVEVAAIHGIEKVEFPTWTDKNGQDDIKWYTGKIENGRAKATVDMKYHGYRTGKYITHVHLIDKKGNKISLNATPKGIVVKNEAPIIRNVRIKKRTGYYVIKADVTDDYGIRKVQVPSWSARKGQDDIIWHKAIVDKDGHMTCKITSKAHKKDAGKFISHIYAFDKAGKRTVYKIDPIKVTRKCRITNYKDASGNMNMCYAIDAPNGEFIMIDGGYSFNADKVRSIIKEKGEGIVDKWILTHPHGDHIGAFNEIWSSPAGIRIKKVYTAKIGYNAYKRRQIPTDHFDPVFKEFYSLTEGYTNSNFTYLHSGDQLSVGGMSMEVFSAYDKDVRNCWDKGDHSYSFCNDAGLMFKLTNDTESMLFCSDVSVNMSKFLRNKYGSALNCTYIQCAHHGNRGMDEAFYKMAAPEKGAFIDAPRWLLYGDWASTRKTIGWLKKIGLSDGQIYTHMKEKNQIYLF